MKKLILLGIFTGITVSSVLAQQKEYKEHYPNGILKVDAFVDNNGKPSGKFKSFNKQGGISVEAYYVNGKLNGEMKQYDALGGIILTGNYSVGTENGKWTSYGSIVGYPKGTKFIELDVAMAKITSFKKYHANGKIWIRGNFSPTNINTDIIKALRTPDIENTQKKQGKYEEFNQNGQLKYTVNFSDGKISGESKSFYETGEVYEVCKYDNNGYRIATTSYHIDGKLKSKMYYQNGKPQGDFIAYFPYGEISDKGKYINGDKDGYWLEEYGVGNYQMGKKTGFWKKYAQRRDEKEKLKVSEGNYMNGLKNGQWKEFNYAAYQLGKWAIETGVYNNGKRTGLWKYTHPDGTPVETKQY
ncbi:toxin-antitoxin system YwqK family antitoxin [Pedobacter insulae]|uniref:Antitoxin component YwqK of the YwqJK toxin-antitoxin module n=1 Tax=Pedobacter insulae TaxID=414048 RepID=A0A1I2WXW2_9SPHI|nr:hypothetical protein [Pedobacter insulae]SFH06032.1 Antitoxin component YwqK of the YwqJK toxin-antitoxin module [Pedobacter insulae]